MASQGECIFTYIFWNLLGLTPGKNTEIGSSCLVDHYTDKNPFFIYLYAYTCVFWSRYDVLAIVKSSGQC